MKNEIRHVAIIMDGNGRWAKKRGLPRSLGHKAGENAVKEVITECFSENIEVLSLFAFSTENWKRDKSEVDYLFKLLRDFIVNFKDEAIKRRIRVKIMGDVSPLDKDLQVSLKKVEEETAKEYDFILNIGLNYGGRADVVQAVNKAVKAGKVVTEESFKSLLYTDELPDPDLIIRTSGEMRLSNFMIFQGAYSELYFTDVLWPDFGKEEFIKAIKDFNGRKRRFGKA